MPASVIRSSAATVPFIVPTALTSNIVWRVVSSCSQELPVISTPALLTQRSSEPLREIAAAAAARQASWSRTSSSIEVAPTPIASAVSAAAAGVDVGREHDEAPARELDRDRPPQTASRSRYDRRRHTARSGYSMRLQQGGLPTALGCGSEPAATIVVRAERPRGERKPLEESPDTEGRGGG